jgi:hypothetical protein
MAYRATDYVVEAAEGAFTLRVDEASAALATLHARRGVGGSVFISAWNPLSVPRSDGENDHAHACLLAALVAGGHGAIEGWGRDPSGEWPAERSLLVPGLALPLALALAQRFGQNALLYAAEDAVPRLVWTGRD